MNSSETRWQAFALLMFGVAIVVWAVLLKN